MENKCDLLFPGLLIALVFISFSPLRNAGFISFDDPDYVTKNEMVQRGLSIEGIKWAFTTGHSSNWHPLTWLAHMFDWQLFGDNAGAHHLSNLLLHSVNAVFIFLLFKKMTGTFWRSGIVAALFALHPLHVESVAWISEKKDLLSTFFGLLSALFYVRYSQESEFQNPKSKISYGLALLFFAPSLMSKPMLVTLPFIFLLLDFWPLQKGRSLQKGITSLLVEKIPFFALSLGSSLATFFVQQSGGAVRTMTEVAVSHRFANALVSYVIYLRKMIWPSDLAIFYPPVEFSTSQILGAAILLAGISIAAIFTARSRPYFLTGWLWFCGMLVPVIGIVQVGEQALADRYSYFPLVGLFAAITWGAADLLNAKKYKPMALAGATSAVAACALLTFFQSNHWQNNQTLFRHAVAVTEKNYLAHNHLATDFLRKNEDSKAKEHLILAVKYRPQFSDARVNLGCLLAREGNLAEAQVHFEETLRYAPAFDSAHFNLAILLKSQGKLDEAADHYAAVIELNPTNADAHSGLAFIFAQRGDMKRAAQHFSEASHLKPNDAVTHFNFATALLNLAQTNEAIVHYSKAIQLQPDFVSARYQLAVLFSEQGKTSEAISELAEAVRIQPTFSEAKQRLESLKNK